MTSSPARADAAESTVARAKPPRAGWRVSWLAVVVAVIALCGTATLLYPTVAAWFHQKTQSEVIARLSAEIDQEPPTGLGAALVQARRYNAYLEGGVASVAAFSNVPEGQGSAASGLDYDDALRADATGLMARLKIPSIGVDLPIYHGTSDATLLRGVGHLEGTALPVGGEGTHAVLTGHRGLAESELFTNLDRIAKGDTFTIEVFGDVLTYRVAQIEVVDPSDTETLYPVRGQDLVTLVTCTPLGINSQRILVTGERVTPTPIEDVQAAGARPDVPGFPWWALIGGTVVVGAAAYVWLMGRPPRAAMCREEPERHP